MNVLPYVTIIKQVTREEQTKTDGSVIRIEAGRQLIIAYEVGAVTKTQTITL